MRHITFLGTLIETAGYDAQRALLEVRLIDGGVCRYKEVPEDVWYRLREEVSPDRYYRRYICGCFPEC